MSKKTCGTCVYFDRLKFHRLISADGGYQKCGSCKLLCESLAITNSSLWVSGHLYVQESFGCNMHQIKKDYEDWVEQAEIAIESKSPELDRSVLIKVYEAMVSGKLKPPQGDL